MKRSVAFAAAACLAAGCGVLVSAAPIAIPQDARTAPAAGGAKPLACDLAGYKPQEGLRAAVQQDSLVVTWAGEQGSELRMRLGIDAGQPIVRGMAVRRAAGPWGTLARNLKPEFDVVAGKRRANNELAAPLAGAAGNGSDEVERVLGRAARDPGIVQPTEGRAGEERGRRGARRRAGRCAAGMPRLSRRSAPSHRDGLWWPQPRARGYVPRAVDGDFFRAAVYTVYRGTNRAWKRGE